MMDVAPNPIDFSAVAAGFSSMLETGNVVVFAFIIVIFLLYVLVLVWSRRADKRDTEQVLFFSALTNETLEHGCTSRTPYKMSSAHL